MNKNVISTPQPEGTWPFFAPRALPSRPRAVERSSRPEGGLEVPEGQKMSHVPEGWGVEITFLFIRAHPVTILPSFKV